MRGVVSGGDRKTVAAGSRILEAGGNAIDAVVAAAFASWVAEAPLGSAAGAGLMIHGNASRGYELVDFFTRVPGLG
ncbi:MAG: gamma-glutamyltransferase, partial [Myxococcales bacterium]|nr:gamma-glutamyltransferase [Myxococcales bacterium]